MLKTLKALKLAVVAGLLMVLAFAAVPSAGAQQGVVWTVGVQIQNLGSAAAQVTLTFYDSVTGNSAGSTQANIAAGGSTTFFPIPVVSNGFKGSAVVSSDQPVAAIMNLLGNGGTYGGSATGLSAGSQSVGLPLILRGNSGIDTWFNVQNAGSTDANITITYKPGSSGTATTETATIKAGAAKTFDQSTNAALGVKFIGSATVTSNQPVVAVVNQVGKNAPNKTLLTYTGFASGSATAALPLVMANNSNIFTGISLQNVGNAQAQVTVTYSANTVAGMATPTPDVVTLAAGAAGVLIQSGGKWTGRYVGAATVTSAQPVVAIVNQLSPGQGTAYEGFNPASLTTKISAPLLMANNGAAKIFTAVQIQNVGSTSTTVTVDYSPNTAGAFNPANDVRTIAPGASVTIFQAGGAWGANRYVGGATITSTGGNNIAAIINQAVATPNGDNQFTYDGINF